jgi:hypothetical protein
MLLPRYIGVFDQRNPFPIDYTNSAIREISGKGLRSNDIEIFSADFADFHRTIFM